MKKVLLLTSLLMFVSQCIYGMDLNSFVLLGDSAQVSLSLNVAKSILRCENEISQNSYSLVIGGASKKALDFIDVYSSLRLGAKENPDECADVNEGLVNKLLNGMPLDELVHTTLIVGDLYDELVPHEFDLVWSHQLNQVKIRAGHIWDLMKNADDQQTLRNEKVLDAILVLQDVSQLIQESTIKHSQLQQSSTDLPTDEQMPVYIPADKLEDEDKNGQWYTKKLNSLAAFMKAKYASADSYITERSKKVLSVRRVTFLAGVMMLYMYLKYY